MEFAPSKHQEDVCRRARRFVETHVLPHADAWDKSGEFPKAAWAALAKAGLAGIPIPAKYLSGVR